MPLRRKGRPAPVSDPADEMTTTEVMWYRGYATPRAALVWCRRMNVPAIGRRPGNRGENVYSRAAVVAAEARMVGRGVGGGVPAHRPKSVEVTE